MNKYFSILIIYLSCLLKSSIQLPLHDDYGCKKMCSETVSCPFGERCIKDGCNYLCYEIPPQDIRCPAIASSWGYCEDKCNHKPMSSSDCFEGFICCFNGCGNECVPEGSDNPFP